MPASESRDSATHAPTSDVPDAMSIDLAQEIEQLHTADAWQRGRSAKRLTHFRNLRVTLFALKAGVRLGEHHNAGRVTVQTIRGRVRVTASGRTFELPPARLVVLDRNVPHDVEAVEESAFLVSVAFEDRDQPA